MVETVLLTGASGFIAKHVALQLLQAGHVVRGSVRTGARGGELRAALAPHLPPEALARLEVVELDLLADAGWGAAMAGISALVHTASPFPIAQPKNPDDVIRPAVEGTRRALEAAAAAGVRRVVLTSSTVAVLNESLDEVQDEEDWCDLSLPSSTAYARSKTMAERLAWQIAGERGLALTTVNPGMVLGPPLDADTGSSVGLVRRILSGKDPMLPPFGFPVVDVRDVATVHLRALERPDSAGLRVIAAAGSLTLAGIGQVLKREWPARKIATREAPKWLMRLLALRDAEVRSILPKLGKLERVSNRRAIDVFGMQFIPAEQALLETARWLVASGQV